MEGDLEVTLDVESGTVRAAYVNSPLYRGFEQILQGKDPYDALVFVPRICGICSVAQSRAAAAALAAVEQCAHEAQRDVAGDARHQQVESLGRRARGGEERPHLHLADRHGDATGGQIGLHELLAGVVAAADGEEFGPQRGIAAAADAVGAPRPARRVEERVGEACIVRVAAMLDPTGKYRLENGKNNA